MILAPNEQPCVPGSYSDFLCYLDTVHTEEQLFSRLTYWFAFRESPDDVRFRPDLVEDRAKELKIWSGLDLKVERWEKSIQDEIDRIGLDAFGALVSKDYGDYLNGASSSSVQQLPEPECLQTVQTVPVEWLVPGLLPRGELSILGADGGTGKGIYQAQLIAYVTTGRASSFFPQPLERPGSVMIFSGEDTAGKTLRPRMLAAGADMAKVYAVNSSSYYKSTGKSLTVDSPEFAAYIRKNRPDLIIVDPLQSFLGDRVDMGSRNQMRNAATPSMGLCQELNAAGLLVMHTNKKGDVSGRQRLADSSDLWDMARSVLMMGRSKLDGLIYISHEKSNYAKAAQTALFSIEDAVVEGVHTAKAVFHSYTDRKDADFIQERRLRVAQTKEDATDAILNTLSESKLACMESRKLKQSVMEEIGCSEPTYKRAYSELVKESRIRKKQIRQKDGTNCWFTFLYGADEPENTDSSNSTASSPL